MKKFMFSLSLMISLSMIPARAIIPFNQAMDVFEETKDEWKAISPFWGMVALHGKLLEQIRFFGPYSSLVEDEATRQLQESLIHPSLLPKPTAGDGPLCSEYPLDPIAALIQHLFPCTDGVQFVANTRNQDPVGNLSRHLDKINDLIQILLDQSKIEEKRNKIFSTLKSLDKNTKTKVNKSFAHLLVDAYQRQNQLANPMRPDQQLYPENIVVISLLSFFCQVADYQCDFDKLPFLMKMEDTTKHVFTKGNYYNFRLRDKTTLDQIIADTHHPELAFLMGKGYEVYENFASDPIPYRGDISYKTSPAFPDCGETSLRNVLMLILEDQGTIPETFLRTLEKKIIPIPDLIIQDPKNPFQKMVSYFQNHDSLTDAATKEAHDDWAEVVSNLNNTSTDHTLEDIQYGRGQKGENYTYEIKASQSSSGVLGLINMLNVIAKIIPDQQLNLPWSQNEQERYLQAQKKVSRLCELLSREGREISWENKDTRDQQITDSYVTLTLIINHEKAYDWHFKKGHFQLDPLKTENNDWRIAYKDYDKFPNNWMSALYRRLHYFGSENPQQYRSNASLDLIYNRSLKRVDGALETIAMVLDGELELFYPLISRWIQKSIPLNDPEALSKLTLLLYGFQDHAYINKLQIPNMSNEIQKINHNRQESLVKAAREGYLQTVAKLIAEGGQVNSQDDQGFTPLHWAAKYGNTAVIKCLIDHGSCVNTTSKNKETPLHLAAQYGHEAAVKILLENGAPINCRNTNGETPLHQSVQSCKAAVVKHLLSRGAPVNVKDSCGFTPIQWATRFRSKSVLDCFIN